MHYPTEVPVDVELIRDVVYGSVRGRALLLDLARPKNRHAGALLPAFVYMHGGAWKPGGKRGWRARDLLLREARFRRGERRLRAERRGAIPRGNRGLQMRGALPARARCLGYSIDAERIGAMGASSGGHLAALLGLTAETQFAGDGGWGGFSSGVCAVCDLFGVNDFLQMPEKHHPGALTATARFLGGTIDEVRPRYIEASPVNYVHAGAPPFLLIHGDADELVPLNQSELLRDALMKAGVDVEFHVVKGAAHGSRNVITPEVREKILAFLMGKVAGR